MMHRDGQAIVSVVVSLSEYGTDYTGGLYVAANGAGRQAIALGVGDAVFHSYDLLHGVQVKGPSAEVPGVRWSWILWYKDSTVCEQHG
jgi:predicted 2-oxoglutarate/Fe(II)-dependent dioxygenase YbiX